jgi:hypothetical protein
LCKDDNMTKVQVPPAVTQPTNIQRPPVGAAVYLIDNTRPIKRAPNTAPGPIAAEVVGYSLFPDNGCDLLVKNPINHIRDLNKPMIENMAGVPFVTPKVTKRPVRYCCKVSDWPEIKKQIETPPVAASAGAGAGQNEPPAGEQPKA